MAEKVMQMKVGDAPLSIYSQQGVQCAYWAARKAGFKIAVRQYEGDNFDAAEGHWRVWRIE